MATLMLAVGLFALVAQAPSAAEAYRTEPNYRYGTHEHRTHNRPHGRAYGKSGDLAPRAQPSSVVDISGPEFGRERLHFTEYEPSELFNRPGVQVLGGNSAHRSRVENDDDEKKYRTGYRSSVVRARTKQGMTTSLAGSVQVSFDVNRFTEWIHDIAMKAHNRAAHVRQVREHAFHTLGMQEYSVLVWNEQLNRGSGWNFKPVPGGHVTWSYSGIPYSVYLVESGMFENDDDGDAINWSFAGWYDYDAERKRVWFRNKYTHMLPGSWRDSALGWFVQDRTLYAEMKACGQNNVMNTVEVTDPNSEWRNDCGHLKVR